MSDDDEYVAWLADAHIREGQCPLFDIPIYPDAPLTGVSRLLVPYVERQHQGRRIITLRIRAGFL